MLLIIWYNIKSAVISKSVHCDVAAAIQIQCVWRGYRTRSL